MPARSIRWKSRYKTGDADVDRRNRAFVDCLNSLIKAAGKREHCREVDDFLGCFGADAEQILDSRPTDRDLSTEFGHRLRAALPLDAFGSTSCRQCGLCDLAEKRIAEHLGTPVRCLFKSS